MSKSHSSLIVPYVSAFLTQLSLSVAFIATPILAYMMEASPFLIGLIGASAGATYAAMTRVFGSICDRFSRKKLLFASEVIQALSMMVCFFSQDPYQLILSRLVFAFGAALFWPLVIAYVGDLVEADHLGQALAGYNVSWSSATVIGPQLGGLLIVWFSIRTSFLVSFAVLFFTATLLLLGTKARIERSRHVVHLTKSEKLVRENSRVFPLIHAFLVAFTAATLSAIFPAYATQLGVPADQIGLMFLLSGLTQTLTVLLANRLQSKLGEGIMLLSSSFLLICSLTMIGLILTVQLFFVSFAIFGLGQGMAYSTAIFSVLKGSGSRRGKAAGVFESTLGVGFFIGPLVGGILYQLGGSYPYFFGAFLSLWIMISHLFMKLRRVRTNV
ncbi:MAG: MFS transporter [Candidatus Bathyarchaeia archaeon]